MIQLTTPRGLPVSVPENPTEDLSPRFDAGNWRAAKEYYEENGYVVFGRLIAPELCDRIRNLWDREVKPFKGYMYRQASSGRAEKHLKNENGWVMNPILNLQSVNPIQISRFSQVCATERSRETPRCGTHYGALGSSAENSSNHMVFEGNSENRYTPDSYYLDSETSGNVRRLASG